MLIDIKLHSDAHPVIFAIVTNRGSTKWPTLPRPQAKDVKFGCLWPFRIVPL